MLSFASYVLPFHFVCIIFLTNAMVLMLLVMLSQTKHCRFPVELNFTALMAVDKYIKIIIFLYNLIVKSHNVFFVTGKK